LTPEKLLFTDHEIFRRMLCNSNSRGERLQRVSEENHPRHNNPMPAVLESHRFETDMDNSAMGWSPIVPWC
jgi:hypothetical protein